MYSYTVLESTVCDYVYVFCFRSYSHELFLSAKQILIRVHLPEMVEQFSDLVDKIQV